jgi:RHS repeat-associated protein
MKKELGELTGDTVNVIECNFSQIIHLQGEDPENYENACFWYSGNHLSSTQLITDIAGSISQAVLYAPFGQVISEYRSDWMMDTIPRFLFNAKEMDEESKLIYYGARYYDPARGIYNSRDRLFEK